LIPASRGLHVPAGNLRRIRTIDPREARRMNISDSRRKLLNFGSFQLAWFACVLAAAEGRALLATLAVAAAVAAHLWLAPRRAPEAMLVLVVTSIGLFWDSLVVSLGLVRYSSGNFADGVAPVWIIAMWALFATTLNLSLGWMKGRPWLAAVAGAVGGPLAFFSAYRLGSVELVEPVLALVAQGLGWSAIMPLLVALAARLNGFEAEGTPPSSRVGHGGPRHA